MNTQAELVDGWWSEIGLVPIRSGRNNQRRAGDEGLEWRSMVNTLETLIWGLQFDWGFGSIWSSLVGRCASNRPVIRVEVEMMMDWFDGRWSVIQGSIEVGATGYPLAATDLDSVDPSDDGHPADSDRQLQAGWSRSMRLKTIYLSIYPLRFRLIVSIEFQDPKTIKAIATIDSDRRKASLVLSSPLSSSSSLD